MEGLNAMPEITPKRLEESFAELDEYLQQARAHLAEAKQNLARLKDKLAEDPLKPPSGKSYTGRHQ
jgi:ABC-type transporter Mla subunit MlaD